MPSARATASAVALPSPVTITGASPSARSARTALSLPGFCGSATAITAASFPSTAASTGVRASLESRATTARAAPRSTPSRSIQRSAPTWTRCPSTVAVSP